MWKGKKQKKKGGKERFKLIHTLTQPADSWTGLKGRIGKELLEKEIGRKKKVDGKGEGEGDEIVLVCGPEELERVVKRELNALGWGDADLLFF